MLSSAIEEAVEEALHPAKPSKSKGTTKKAAPPKRAKAKKAHDDAGCGERGESVQQEARRPRRRR